MEDDRVYRMSDDEETGTAAREIVESPLAPPAKIMELLAEEFIGRDDEFWGIVGEGASAKFAGTELRAWDSAGYALTIREKLPGRRVQVFTFAAEDNPWAAVSEDRDGHDFAVVDGRYIVDPWALEVGVVWRRMRGQRVLDMRDKTHADEIDHLYGDPDMWLEE